jgi:hypothetical protein
LQSRLQIAPVGLIKTWKAGGAFLGNVRPLFCRSATEAFMAFSRMERVD